MTDPTEIARGIIQESDKWAELSDYGLHDIDWDKFRDAITDALREYGDQRYNDGKIAGVEGIASHIQSVTNARKEADAEGVKRGLAEGEALGYRRGWLDRDIGYADPKYDLSKQRNQEGGK